MEKVYLFAPGNSERKIMKALTSEADAVIIDLEDAVVSLEKGDARQLVFEVLNREEIINIEVKIYVRINSIKTPWFFDDLKMVKQLENIAGIMIPKSEDQTSITLAAELLGRELEIIPLIETAAGVLNLKELLISHPAVRKVAFGSVDYALDLGVDWSEEGIERIGAMQTIVLTSRALGKEPPIDAVYPIINDQEKFIADTKKGKQTGFYGKLVIHPKQIGWVNEVYQPTARQLEWSQKVIDVFEHADHNGAIDLDGKLIDLPVYLLAKRLVSSQS